MLKICCTKKLLDEIKQKPCDIKEEKRCDQSNECCALLENMTNTNQNKAKKV